MPIRIRRERTEIEIPSSSPEVVRAVMNSVFNGASMPALPAPRQQLNLDDLRDGEEIVFDSEGGFHAR